MQFDVDILKQDISSYLKGDSSAFDKYRYLSSADVSLCPSFPLVVYKKICSLVRFNEGETITLNKDVLSLLDPPYDNENKEYTTFKRFNYEKAFVNMCRLVRINGITDKDRLFCLVAVELTKKWKGTKVAGVRQNIACNIMLTAEMLTNDVWCECSRERKSDRYYEAETMDSPNTRKLKYKYCNATVERIKEQWNTKYGYEPDDINVRKWLDGKIIGIVIEYALVKWKDLSKEEIALNIFEEFGIHIGEKRLQNRREDSGIKRFKHKKHKKHKKSSKQMSKEDGYLKLITEEAQRVQTNNEELSIEEVIEKAVKHYFKSNFQLYQWWHRKSKEARKELIEKLYNGHK